MKPPGELAHKGDAVEEWIDLHFYRPLGLRLARRLLPTRVSADQVTLAATVVGIVAGHLFFYQSARVNAAGFALFVVSDLLDSADGQLARLRGTATRLGRVVDGMGDGLRFVSLYAHLAIRLMRAGQGPLGLGLAVIAIWSHSLQSAAVDFVRNAFLRLGTGDKSELDLPEDVAAQKAHGWFEALAGRIYRDYLRRQEMLLPRSTQLVRRARDVRITQPFRVEYRRRQQPLLIACTWLGQNVHLILLGMAGAAGRPAWYLWSNVTVLNLVLLGLVIAHEANAGAMAGWLGTEAYAESA